MIKILKENHIYAFRPDLEPVAYANHTDEIIFETYDCYREQIKLESINKQYKLEGINPATGTLYVQDALPGDTLKISILSIELNEEGTMYLRPGAGVLKNYVQHYEVKKLKIKKGLIHYNQDYSFKVLPMIGVIGVAAEREISTTSPGRHGGNMDTKEITVGASLYLPIFIKGAKLAIGDLHAIMGDGEVPICGVEIGGRVRVKIELIKSKICEWPLLEDENNYYLIASAKTLDEACEIAAESMFKFLTKQLPGVRPNDLIRLMGIKGDLRISQIVNPWKTSKFILPKSLFGPLSLT